MFLSAFLWQCPWSVPCTLGRPGQEEHSQQYGVPCLHRPANAFPWLITTATPERALATTILQLWWTHQGTKLWCLQNSKTSTPKLFNLCSPACFHGLKARPGTDEPTGRLALHGRCRIGPTSPSLDAGGGHRDGDSSHPALHGHPPPLHPGNESGCSHKACRLHASSISDSCLHFKGKDDCRQHHFMCISSGPFAYGELQRQV